MTDLNELMKKAREMQEQMQKAQQEAASRIVTGESGAGLVRIEMTGRYDVRKVQLSPELMREDREIVEDLIAAAINDAVKRVEEGSRDALSGLTAGIKLPEGFRFPF
jgi:nucleoid-associated protein EbfC